MAGDTANPRVWLNGDVYTAPVGSTAPVNVAAAWDTAWKAVGLLSEDGLTEAREEDSTDHYAWGGILVRTTRSHHKRSFSFTVLEDNLVVFGLVAPGSTAATATAITTRTIKVPTVNVVAFGVEMKDGTVTKRLVIPRGEVVEVGDTTFGEADMAMRELTVNVLPASDGTLYKEITNDPQAVVP